LAEGGFDLAGLGNQTVLGSVPNVNDEIVFERCDISSGEFLDPLLLDFLCREKGMLALCKIVATNALQGPFRPVDLLSDILRVEIDRDGVVKKRQRGERPEDPAASALRTALEDHQIIIKSVCEKSEIPSCLNTLMPAVLLD
jgi:hypothetical protein